MRRFFPALLIILAPFGLWAHGYDEFTPLDPSLRAALIDILVSATEEEDFTRHVDPEMPGATDTVEGILDSLDPAVLSELATQLRARAGVTDPARLPDSIILPLFYDLDDFIDHYKEHGHGPNGDDAASADYLSLQTLLKALEVK
ncbi:hypothetical protein [Celeribacter sp.]|uniref:hypothetical protein n=1 Tax=Celeribacter sp. TaxID=1890673 RepID=UPI003A8D77C9